MVDVPVEQQDALDTVTCLGGTDCDGRVVQQAKAHRAIRLGVVSGGANRAEARVELTPAHAAHELDRAARRELRDVEAGGSHVRVGIQRAGRDLGGLLQLIQVLPPVHAQDLLGRGVASRHAQGLVAPRGDRLPDGRQPFGSLRVTRRPHVIAIAAILDDADAAAGGHGAVGYPRQPWAARHDAARE